MFMLVFLLMLHVRVKAQWRTKWAQNKFLNYLANETSTVKDKLLALLQKCNCFKSALRPTTF